MITCDAPFVIFKRCNSRLVRGQTISINTILWEDWMWEVSAWFGKTGSYDTEFAAYQLLRPLQGRYILRLFDSVRFFCITLEPTPLRLITDVVKGLALESIPGVSMEKLQPGINVSEQEVARISSSIITGLHAIGARTTTSTPGTVFCAKGIGFPSLSTSERPTSRSLELAMKIGERRSGYALHEEDPTNGRWTRTVTLGLAL